MTDTEYALGRTEREYGRLIQQAELIRPMTRRMLTAAGLEAGMNVLDVGCGVGDMSFLVSELVGAGGSVVGVDIDRAALAHADRRRAERGLATVEFRAGDIGSVEFDRRFDAAVGRFVLMYAEQPIAVLRHLAGLLRPGGIAAFHEWVGRVHGVSAARQPVLWSTLELIARGFERSGANLNIGLELYSHMLAAGLEPVRSPIAEIGMQMGQREAAARRWALLARSILPKLIEHEIATEAEVDVDTLERRLLSEADREGAPLPLTWLMVGQWARRKR